MLVNLNWTADSVPPLIQTHTLDFQNLVARQEEKLTNSGVVHLSPGWRCLREKIELRVLSMSPCA